MHKSHAVVLIVITLIFSMSQLMNFQTILQLQGTVVSDDKQGLSNVHVYTILGEEETITNEKGEFNLKTSEDFPVKLVVQSPGYQDTILHLKTSLKNLLIVLKRK